MNEGLFWQIEQACMTLKHTPESADPYALRSILREAQTYVEILRSLTSGSSTERFEVQRRVLDDGYLEYAVTMTATLSSEELRNLYDFMSG